MKKLLSLLLVVILGVTLCACGGNNATLKDYSGKWVREEWMNPTTGAVVSITCFLYEDGTFTQEVDTSINGYKEYQEYQGTWEINKDTIELRKLRLVEGTDDLFDENGSPKDGIVHTSKLTIVDKITLESGGNKYFKEVS